jgi:hypothetical protein
MDIEDSSALTPVHGYVFVCAFPQLVECFYLSAAASEAHRVIAPLEHDKQGRCVQRSGAPPQKGIHTDKTPDYQFITAATTWQSLLRVMFCAASNFGHSTGLPPSFPPQVFLSLAKNLCFGP